MMKRIEDFFAPKTLPDKENQQVRKIDSSSSKSSSKKPRIGKDASHAKQRASSTEVSCPVCGIKVFEINLNTHLDSCLSRQEDLQGQSGNAEPVISLQTSIGAGGKCVSLGIPTFFFLDVGKKKACFLKKPPSSVGWNRVVYWRGPNVEINLCSNVNFDEVEVDEKNTLKGTPSYTSIPVLKSLIQKCVRRQKCGTAVQAAYNLILHSPSELLRRLPIIFIEDVTLPPFLPFVIWWMLYTSKNNTLPLDIAEHILGIVASITLYPIKDSLVHSKSISSVVTQESGAMSYLNERVFSMEGDQRSCIMGLQVRKSFGGMHGDQDMLDAASKLWIQRFLQSPDISFSWKSLGFQEISPVKITSLKAFDPKDWVGVCAATKGQLYTEH
eukprot:Nk52_evm13s343 gene=Nk52_evmTU13s343